MPWLFTGTISVRSRFTGPTPVARFSIAVVISGKLSACRLREPEKRTRSRNEKQADVKRKSAIRPCAAKTRAGNPRQRRARTKIKREMVQVSIGNFSASVCKTLRLEHCRIIACVQL